MVDMSRELEVALRGMLAKRKEHYFGLGRSMPAALFPSPTEGRRTSEGIQDAMEVALRRAGLPDHFTPHCLRHTFASQLLQNGENLDYVKRMLGHASISMTADLYGHWLPVTNTSAVDRLDGMGSES